MTISIPMNMNATMVMAPATTTTFEDWIHIRVRSTAQDGMAAIIARNPQIVIRYGEDCLIAESSGSVFTIMTPLPRVDQCHAGHLAASRYFDRKDWSCQDRGIAEPTSDRQQASTLGPAPTFSERVKPIP
jgi:hypothetical protein